MYKTYRYLLALISAAIIIVLTLIYSIAFRKHESSFLDIADLIQQIIPNLIASLLIYLCVYWFIERFVDDYYLINMINGMSSSKTSEELLKDSSIENLKSFYKELEGFRDKLKNEISVALVAANKSTTIEERNILDSKLKGLYLKLNDIELQVENIGEKLDISTLGERDAEIKELKLKNKELLGVIAKHKEIAKKINEDSNKI